MVKSPVPESTLTERQGVHYVGLVASQMGMIWRETPNTDLGIDGYLEIILHGAPIGLIALQIKSGKSFIGSKQTFNFRAETRHVRYWLGYRLPVIIILYDPNLSKAYWRYIQDYFHDHDAPNEAKTVSIPINKNHCFDQHARDLLIDIATTPDATAHAMLALRTSRYNRTRELLTPLEMVELYSKRGWLGSWIPLDICREQIILHSALARRGPGWYWFQSSTKRNYVPHLRTALEHPGYRLQEAAALALAAAIGRESIPDLQKLCATGDIFTVTKAVATIPNLLPEDIETIFSQVVGKIQSKALELTDDDYLVLLSDIAKFGSHHVSESVLHAYLALNLTSILPNAGNMWTSSDLPSLRQLAKAENLSSQRFAISALAEIGESQDVDAIITHIETTDWFQEGSHRLRWLAQCISRFFGVHDLNRLRQISQGNDASRVIGDVIFPLLCQRLDKAIILQLMADPILEYRAYAIDGLVESNQWNVILEHAEIFLYDIENYQNNEEKRINLGESIYKRSLLQRISTGLTGTGKWEIIERLLEQDVDEIRLGIAKGLRYVHDQRSEEYLFQLIADQDPNRMNERLAAAESLVSIGNEITLHKITHWIQQHQYENTANLMSSVLNYLDHRLYCPIQWPINIERDFTTLRFSVTRDDHR